jgi:hypothetical protein
MDGLHDMGGAHGVGGFAPMPLGDLGCVVGLSRITGDRFAQAGVQRSASRSRRKPLR